MNKKKILNFPEELGLLNYVCSEVYNIAKPVIEEKVDEGSATSKDLKFEVRISVPNKSKAGKMEIGCGVGPNKKAATRNAAKVALNSIMPKMYEEWK